MSETQIREWEEPEDDFDLTGIDPDHVGSPFYILGGLLSADDDEFDLEQALTFLRDITEEFSIYLAKFEAIKKLQDKCKEYIRDTGESPDVPGVVLKFGKPSKRKFAYLKKLVESAEKEHMGETIARMAELYPHLRTKKAKALLADITQEFAKQYMPLSSFFYEKDINPSIKIII